MGCGEVGHARCAAARLACRPDHPTPIAAALSTHPPSPGLAMSRVAIDLQ